MIDSSARAPSVPPLRLFAQDEEDLRVMSAHLQDAILRMGDIAYLPHRRRFAAVFNRYCWEVGAGEGQRMHTGLHFDGVLGVKLKGIRQDNADAVLSLLAIHFTVGEACGGTVDLCFSGGGLIRLEVECIEASLRDLGGPWKASGRPAHRLGDAERA